MATIEQLREKRKTIEAGGGEKAIAKQHDSGKLTARERIDKLLDPGSFVELNAFVKHRCTNFGMETREIPGDGVVTGYGTINGRLVYLFSQDFTAVGGTLGEKHADKINFIQDLALKNGAPIICLNDSGGGRVQEGYDSISGYARVFYKHVLASGVIPQISLILGSCAGGATYSPALTDFIFTVDQISKMFIAGPNVIKAVTGEDISQETLGGAVTNNSVNGNAHFLDSSEDECFDRVKSLLSFLPQNNLEKPMDIVSTDDPNRIDEELNTIIPEDANKAYDMKNVISIIADNGEFLEYQPLFAQNMITGYIRLNGKSVGVVANQPSQFGGALDINASDKAARFVRTCDAFNIPLLMLVDVPGFMPGAEQEYGGIIRHGAKMLYAFGEATVPKVQVVLRKGYGGSIVAMCTQDMGADYVFAWPTAQVAIMGAAGAANIVFAKEIKAAPEEEQSKIRQEKIKEYEEDFCTPFAGAARGHIHDIIEPSETRKRVISAFETLETKQELHPAKKHGNIPL